MGLRQTALDVLLATDWEKFAGKEPDQLRLQQRELSLMMQTGQVEAVGKELVEDQEKLQSGVGLGMDPDTMLPAYEWLRVEVAAAQGDYAEADHWLEEIEKKMRQSAPLLTTLPLLGVCGPDEPGLHEPDTRSLTGLLVGHLVLRQAPAVNGLWLPLPLSDAGGVILRSRRTDRGTAGPGGRPGGDSRLAGAGSGRCAGGRETLGRGPETGSGRRGSLPRGVAGAAVPGAAERGEMTARRPSVSRRPERSAPFGRTASAPLRVAANRRHAPQNSRMPRRRNPPRPRSITTFRAVPPAGRAPAARGTGRPAATRKSARPA